MKPYVNRRFVIAVLTVACLTTVLLTVAPIRSSAPGPGEYDVWLDWNDDGKIDMRDISRVALAFGRSGLNVSKASLAYDSGWLDLRNETGETYTITHNLNDTELQVDAREYSPGWNKTYTGVSSSIGNSVIQTNDGGYAVTGWTDSGDPLNSSWHRDAWLVKTDASGNMQWNKAYGGPDDTEAYSMVQTSDGGYALAGQTFSLLAPSGSSTGLWLLKTDGNGDPLWNKTYGQLGYVAYSLVETSDGGYALAGTAGSGFLLVKTDVNGDALWNRTYTNKGVDCPYSIIQTSDGGYALAGSTSLGEPLTSDFWLVRTDANGNALWNQTYSAAGDDEAFSVVQTSDGGYALAGITGFFSGAGAGSGDFWLIRTDPDGNALWNKTYGGPGSDWAYSMVQTNDGGYALAGITVYFGAGHFDAWLVKTDSMGNQEWNEAFGGVGWDYVYSVIQTRDGGYVLVGFTDSYGVENSGAWLIKTDAEFGLTWVSPSANTITLYRGAADTSWNFVRVRLWKPR